MVIIRSYTTTTIEQSKVLAKILPLESADMAWVGNSLGKPYARTILINGDPEELCACWSLAALLVVLPASCDEGQHCLALINSNPNGDTEWLCCYEDCKGHLMMECYADNQIDACYELIIKLNEQKLL